MATTETKIWQALKAKVATISGYDFDWPQSEFTPSDAPYLEVRHLPNYSNRLTIENSGQSQYKGILQLSLMYPITLKHSGEVMLEKAGLIKAQFTQGTLLSFQGVNVEIEKQPDIAQPFREDGFWRYPITIRYFSFT